MNCPICFCSLFFICLVFYVLRLMQFQTLCQSNPPLKMFRLISYSVCFIFLRQSVLKRFDFLASELVASAPDTQVSSWNCVSLLFWGLTLTLLCWVSYFLHLMSPSFFICSLILLLQSGYVGGKLFRDGLFLKMSLFYFNTWLIV